MGGFGPPFFFAFMNGVHRGDGFLEYVFLQYMDVLVCEEASADLNTSAIGG